MGGPATKKPRLTIERPCPLARLLRSPDRRDVVQPGRGIYGRHLLGGFGGTSLVVGVRWPFRGKDAGSPNSGQLLGRLRTRPRADTARPDGTDVVSSSLLGGGRAAGSPEGLLAASVGCARKDEEQVREPIQVDGGKRVDADLLRRRKHPQLDPAADCPCDV